jgi:hypothetical protein
MDAAARSVFISFSSKDRKIAETICLALESRGFPCWMSSRDVRPGENYQVAIVKAINAAKVLLLVFSANTNASDEIKKELSLASKRRLMVIPVRTEDVIPDEGFSYELATRQWIDLFAGWEGAMAQLADQIGTAAPAQTRTQNPVQDVSAGNAAASSPAFPTRQQTTAGIAAAAVVLVGALAYFAFSPHAVAPQQTTPMAQALQSQSVTDVMRCLTADPDQSIKGCTADLAEASVTGATRANYYKVRASSYARKFEYQLALLDLGEAISLTPTDGSLFFLRAAIYRVQGRQDDADADAAKAKALGYTPPRPPG